MSKTQFWTLNLVGGACALLLLGNIFLTRANGSLNRSVGATQDLFNQAQRLQTTAQNLVVRIAQSGQTEPALRQLLARHDFRVNLTPESTPSPAQPAP